MARTAKLTVMVKQEIKQQLKQYSEGMGLTESALSAYIIGQWINTQVGVNSKIMSAFGRDELTQLLTKVINNSEVAGAERP